MCTAAIIRSYNRTGSLGVLVFNSLLSLSLIGSWPGFLKPLLTGKKPQQIAGLSKLEPQAQSGRRKINPSN